jgi:hypothetical protein
MGEDIGRMRRPVRMSADSKMGKAKTGLAAPRCREAKRRSQAMAPAAKSTGIDGREVVVLGVQDEHERVEDEEGSESHIRTWVAKATSVPGNAPGFSNSPISTAAHLDEHIIAYALVEACDLEFRRIGRIASVHASSMEAARMHKNNKRPIRRKIVLRLPDFDHAKSSVLNSLSSPHSKRNYKFRDGAVHHLVLFRTSTGFEPNRGASVPAPSRVARTGGRDG